MRKLVVVEWMTLDGVFDGKTMADWFAPFDSAQRQKFIQETLQSCGAILYGRATYEMLAPYWSTKLKNEDGLADKLNSVSKYVVSTTLKKASWNNSTIIKKNVLKEIAKLKEEPGKEIQIEGSSILVQSLMEADLIDEYRFLVHPIIAGSGKSFFKKKMKTEGLKLFKTKIFDQGVILLCYQPANK